MSITLESATPSLDEVIEEVAGWQQEGAPVQVHPGDLGWNGSFGSAALARDVCVWRREGRILAAGMVARKAGLIRMAIAPGVDADETFAAQLLADLSDPGRGVLPADRGTVEARFGAAFRGLLDRSGWVADEPWTPLRRDLTAAVEECGLRIEVLDADHVDDRVLQDRVEVGRASFPSSTFTLERWRAMAGSSAYRRARCLVAYDDEGIAVAATTVWSAGRGRAIVVAAAAALQQLGSSSATVCTPSSNVGGVAAYQSGGFERLPAVTDFRRPS